MGRDPNEEILRRVAREARADAVPELDWDELETRLMRRIKTHETVRKTSFSWRPYALLALAGAGAALAVGLLLRQPTPAAPAPPAAIEAKSDSQTNGDALAPGSLVVATDEPVRVSHRTRAHWTLSRQSRARLLERSERLTIRLESGSVVADVVPHLGRDSFAVEVGQARVSVHGTVFKVELRGERIRVAVSRGSVAVGPRSSTLTPAFVLTAGSSGDFALDGRTGHVNKAERPSGAASRPARGGPSAVREERATTNPRGVSSAQPSELPAEPSIADIESGVMELVDIAGSCFTRHTAPGDGVEVTVRTAVTLEIRPEGTVELVEFAPPLSPAVEACAESGIRQLPFARSTEGTKVTRLLELKR